jgi:hypothetical protein
MKYNKLIFLAAFVMLCSCKEKSNDYLERFTVNKYIVHQKMHLNQGSFFSNVYALEFSENNLIVYDVDNKNFFTLLDLKNNTIVSKFVEKGQGPNEIIGMPTPATLLNNANLFFFDRSKRAVFNVNFSNNKTPIVIQCKNYRTNQSIVSILPLLSGKFVSIGLFEKGRYLVQDSLGNELSYNFSYPVQSNEEQMSNRHKALAFQGDFKRKPTGDKIVFAASTSELIEILKIDSSGEMNMIFQWHGNIGKYTPYGDGKKHTSAAISSDSKVVFVRVNTTNKYIYLLYSGKIIKNNIANAYKGKSIFVIDWDGNPVARYNLDIDVSCIAVSDDDKTLYAIAEQEDTNLVKFKLNH